MVDHLEQSNCSCLSIDQMDWVDFLSTPFCPFCELMLDGDAEQCDEVEPVASLVTPPLSPMGGNLLPKFNDSVPF